MLGNALLPKYAGYHAIVIAPGGSLEFSRTGGSSQAQQALKEPRTRGTNVQLLLIVRSDGQPYARDVVPGLIPQRWHEEDGVPSAYRATGTRNSQAVPPRALREPPARVNCRCRDDETRPLCF